VLAFLVPRVVAVLADHDHSVHRQLAATAAQGQVDGRVDRHAVLCCELCADVAGTPGAVALWLAFGALVNVHRDEFDAKRVEPCAAAASPQLKRGAVHCVVVAVAMVYMMQGSVCEAGGLAR